MTELSFEEKKKYFGASLAIAGVNFDKPELIGLLVELYDKVIAVGGAISIDEIIKITQTHLPPPTEKEVKDAK